MKKNKRNNAKTAKTKGFSACKRALPWFSDLGMMHDHPLDVGMKNNNCRGEPPEESEDWQTIKKYVIS